MMKKFEKNCLVLGGCGQVATSFLEIIRDQKDDLGEMKIYILDVVPPTHEKVKQLHKDIGATFLKGNYKFDLEDILVSYGIGCIVNLIPESSLSMWTALAKLPRTHIYLYLDASIYLQTYSATVNDKENLLLSNFNRFDEIKGKYPKNIWGMCDIGANSGWVNFLAMEVEKKYGDPLAWYVIEYDCVQRKNGAKISDCTWGGADAFFGEVNEGASYFRDYAIPYTLGNSERAIDNPVRFKMRGNEYNGYLTIHSECRSWGKRHKGESAFLYAFDELKEEGCREYRKAFQEEDGEVINPLKYELKGSETLGVKLVYPDKEVNLINHMTVEDVSSVLCSPTTVQVGIGVYCGFKMMLKAYELGISPNPKIDVIDEWLLLDERLYSYYGEILYKLLPLEEEILPFSEGLIKDRLRTPKKEIKLIPFFRESEDKDTPYGFTDIFWYHIEQEFKANFDENDESGTYMGYMNYLFYKAYRHFKEKKWGNYDEAFAEVCDFVEKELDNYQLLDKEYEIVIDAFPMIEEFSISELEDVLVSEGFLQNNIVYFLGENIKKIWKLETEEFYSEVVKMYERFPHYDYLS